MGLLFFFSDMITAKKKAPSSKKELLGNSEKCPLSEHLFWKEIYYDTLKLIICLQSQFFVNSTV